MFRVTVVLVALAGCVDSTAPKVDDGEVTSCDLDSLEGCRAAGDCTWCAPIGGSCTRAYVDLCGGGSGWCAEDAVCRQVCSPVDARRCPVGDHPRFELDVQLGTDVCFCVPD